MDLYLVRASARYRYVGMSEQRQLVAQSENLWVCLWDASRWKQAGCACEVRVFGFVSVVDRPILFFFFVGLLSSTLTIGMHPTINLVKKVFGIRTYCNSI